MPDAVRKGISGFQPRPEPASYPVLDNELDQLAAADPWALNHDVPCTVMGAGLGLAVEGLTSEGLPSTSGILGAVLFVASVVWLLWVRAQPSARQLLVRRIRNEAEVLAQQQDS